MWYLNLLYVRQIKTHRQTIMELSLSYLVGWGGGGMLGGGGECLGRCTGEW